MRGREPLVLGLLFGLGLVLACFVFWPLWESLRGAFLDPNGKPTLRYLTLVFRNAAYVEGFAHALGVATASTLIASAIGFSTAFAFDRWTFPGKKALAALIPLPLMVPPFVGALGIKQLLGQTGALNALLIELGWMSPAHPYDWLRAGRFWAVVILTALHLYPILYFNVSAALARLNPEMEEAAENLGCTGLRKLVKVTMPLIAPSAFAAITIIFIWALTDLGVPLMCDYTTITAVQIFAGLKDIGRNPLVYALVVVVLFATTSLYGLARLTFGRATYGLATKSSARRQPRQLGQGASWACTACFSVLVLLAAIPNIGVVLASIAGDWYRTVLPSKITLAHFERALGHDLVVPSIENSLKYVALSTVLDMLLGVATAYVVVRGRSRLRHVLDAAAMLPLAVPGLVMAFGYLAISRDGRPFAFLNPARDPTILLVIAYAVRRLPFVVRSAAAGFSQISVVLEEAARNLGASAFRSFRRVTLPLLAPHLLAGGVFAFALSMLEVSDSLILAQKQTTFPITKAIYELFQVLGEGRWVAAALGVWAMLFIAAAVALARALLGRTLGGIFRV
ncbi:MAG TPA: iron ABC transporter permease [Polyangiaceae bacterium]